METKNVTLFPLMEPRALEIENGFITKVSRADKSVKGLAAYPMVDCINLNRYSYRKKEDFKASVTHIILSSIRHGTKYLRFDILADDFDLIFPQVDELAQYYAEEITILYAMTFNELNLKLFDQYKDHLHSVKAVMDKGDKSYNMKMVKAVVDLALSNDKRMVIEIDCRELLLYVTKDAYLKGYGEKLTLVMPGILNRINTPYHQFNDMLAQVARAKASVMMSSSNELIMMDEPYRGTDMVALMDAGINVHLTSGNVRDHLNPYGNCNLLEEALTAAQLHKMDTGTKAAKLYNAISLNGAQALGLENYGIETGCKADFNHYEAATIREAMFFNQTITVG